MSCARSGSGYAGDGSLVDIQVTATGIEQRLYRRILTVAQAREINVAADAEAQLGLMVDAAGDSYTSGDVTANVARLVNAQGGASVGDLLRRMGDVQHVHPDGTIDVSLRSDLSSAATIERALPTSGYDVDVDTTVRRVIAQGAAVRFIATAVLQGTDVGGGIIKAIAPVTPEDGLVVTTISRVIARGTIVDKIDADDDLSGIWDADRSRFEWSNELAVTEAVPVEVHGTWQAEVIVEDADADALSGDSVISVPSSIAAIITAEATRFLNRQRFPVETMTLNMALGVTGIPRLTVSDAVTIALGLQADLDVYRPAASDLWLVQGRKLTQPAAAQVLWTLRLSRRLADLRERDFWGREKDGGGAERDIVVGSLSGAPQISQIIPAQIVTTILDVDLDLDSYFNDPDGDALTYTATSSDTSRATVALNGSTLTIHGVAPGAVTVTITASDATRSVAQLVAVTVVGNRAPVVDGAIPMQTLLSTATRVLALLDYFSDPDNNPLTFTAVSSDASVVSVEPLAGRS